jgi:putative endonuclease
MVASASGVLYVGVTNYLERRVTGHQSKRTQGFSSRYNATKLVYFEPFSDIRNAIAREKQWKTWRRDKKVTLIERLNPQWQDLSKDFTIEEVFKKRFQNRRVAKKGFGVKFRRNKITVPHITKLRKNKNRSFRAEQTGFFLLLRSCEVAGLCSRGIFLRCIRRRSTAPLNNESAPAQN